MKNEVILCPECGTTMHWQVFEDRIEYAGLTKSRDVWGWKCARCGETILDGGALEDSENDWLELIEISRGRKKD